MLAATYPWAPDAALALYLAQELLVRQRGSASSLRSGAADRGTTGLILGAIVVCGVLDPLLGALGLAGATALPVTVRWLCSVALAAAAAGLVLRVWSMRVLGTAYSRTLRIGERQGLVEIGPYRRVRHPGYTGSIVALSAANLATGSWLAGLVALIVLVVAYRLRIAAEERMLVAAFGPTYADYQQRTGRLFPRLR
jgi:protein-S-isoprenylcysteine O-methyltransferase Ste14